MILALAHEDYGRLAGLLDAIGDEPVTIHVVPDLFRFASLRGGVEEFEGMPFIHLRESPLYGWNRLAKRVFDFVFSRGGARACSGRRCSLLAAAVKLSSPRARLLPPGAHGPGRPALRDAEVPDHGGGRGGADRAGVGAPRPTSGGPGSAPSCGASASTSCPSSSTCCAGEMSVVGPRPERPVFVERFRQTVPGYMLRHKVKSGITGWAQVNGLRGNTSLEKRIQYDIEYIERWSVWLDLKIIALTVVRVLVDRNAY